MLDRQARFFFASEANLEDIDVIIIKPASQTVIVERAPKNFKSVAQLLKGELIEIHQLPNGDRLFGLKSPASSAGFRIAGSSVISGSAVVMKKCRGGQIATPSCRLDLFRQMVQFMPC